MYENMQINDLLRAIPTLKWEYGSVSAEYGSMGVWDMSCTYQKQKSYISNGQGLGLVFSRRPASAWVRIQGPAGPPPPHQLLTECICVNIWKYVIYVYLSVFDM